VDVEPVDHRRGLSAWLRNSNNNPSLVALIRQIRQRLPGDPDFGDPLSAAGEGTAPAAARAADRLIPQRNAATREFSLAALQVWQAFNDRRRGRVNDAEMTLVFTDMVGFSDWALRAGDDATLQFLRQAAQVTEPPLLEAGGQIVKRMGDGMMVAFTDAASAVRATLAAIDAVTEVEVENYQPRMRAGIHTGHPQRVGSDWFGVDVNIAARVMERATRGGLIVSETTLAAIPEQDLADLGVTIRQVRRQMFAPRQAGVPPELVMYRVTAPPKQSDAPDAPDTSDAPDAATEPTEPTEPTGPAEPETTEPAPGEPGEPGEESPA